jgi:hypothetical protein
MIPLLVIAVNTAKDGNVIVRYFNIAVFVRAIEPIMDY